MCPHIDVNWTDREEGKQEGYEEEEEKEEEIKGGEVAMGSRYHDVHRGRGNKRLLEASSIGGKRGRGGGKRILPRWGDRFWAAEMIYLTTNNIPPHGPGGFISSLSFLRGFAPRRWEVRACLSLRERGGWGRPVLEEEGRWESPRLEARHLITR